MRTETELENRSVLAVWLRGALTYTGQNKLNGLAQAVKQSKMGKVAEKREFLVSGSDDYFISKNRNSVRRSCTAVFLDTLPNELEEKLKEGELSAVSYVHS